MIDLTLLPNASYWYNGRIHSYPSAGTDSKNIEAIFSEYPASAAKLFTYLSTFSKQSSNGPRASNDLILVTQSLEDMSALSAWMMREVSKRGANAIHLSAAEYVITMLKDQAVWGSGLGDLIAQFDFVVLDTIGEKIPGVESEVSASFLFQIINTRYTQCLPTCLIALLPPDQQFVGSFGVSQRISDRLDGLQIKFGLE